MSKSLREQTIRRTLNIILDKFIVVEISNDILRQAINDTNFNDIEDSCQCHFALCSGCDCILTFNKKDFASSNIKVMRPKEFYNSF